MAKINSGCYKTTVWLPERNKFLIENTKGLDRQTAYKLFCDAFPGLNLTITAVSNQRSRLRCAGRTLQHPSTKRKPLYYEDVKSGYVRIKIAQPSTWISKAKWVFVETHPELLNELEETDAFYFADGDRFNFDPDNILLVHRREQTIFIQEGGIVAGDPEQSKLNLLHARLRLAQFDALEKVPGAVIHYNGFRVIREEMNARARAYHRRKREDAEYKNRINSYQNNRHKQRMREDPEYRERYLAYQREWQRKRKEKMQKE